MTTTERPTPEQLARLRSEAEATIANPISSAVEYTDAHDLLVVLTELDAVTRERDRSEAKSAILSRQVDRYLPCPDHRDKHDGTCYVCAAERARTVTDAMVYRAAKVICESGTHSWDDDLNMRALYTQIARRALTAALGGAA